MISGRTSEALELTLPTPGMVRNSRSARCAAAVRASGSSLLSTSCILTPVSGGPTLTRTPGNSRKRIRIAASISLIFSVRSCRATVVMVSTARRASAAAPGAKASPLEPPPTEANTATVCGTSMISRRAASVARAVSASVLPGGSSIVTWVWLRSAAGTKPVGNKGTSEIDPAKNSAAPMAVTSRWRKHQRITSK